MGSYNILLFERQDYESAEVIFATTFEADPSNIDTQVELKELCSPDEIQMLPETRDAGVPCSCDLLRTNQAASISIRFSGRELNRQLSRTQPRDKEVL